MKLLFQDMEIPDLLKDEGRSCGGASVRQLAISEGLIKNGQSVGILTWKGANKFLGKKYNFDLVETYPGKGGIRYLRVFYFYFFLTFLAVKDYKPEVLLVKGCELKNGIFALIARILKIPLVYLVTNDKDADDRYKESLHFIAQKSYQLFLKECKLIICQNSYQYLQFHKAFPDKKFLIMHNPYHTNSVLPSIKEKKDRKYIAWIGIFSNQKNLPLLLRIVKELPNLNFEVAGSLPSGTYGRKTIINKETQDALYQLYECSNVKMSGFLKRTEIIPFLSEAQVLLNTSHFEGFSNTFLESFAAGTPVITRKNIDPDQLIENNNLGITVNNDFEFKDAIVDLLNDPDYSSMCIRARKYLFENHDINKAAKNLMESIYEVV